jgi:uncharacterized membrane protein YjjB (DUF3815 family)
MQPSRVVYLILFGLLVWGTMLALGAYLNNASGWAGLVVASCSLGFISFWGAMLLLRSRKLRRTADSDRSEGHPGNGK